MIVNSNRPVNPAVSDVHHEDQLSEHIGALYLCDDYTDIELIVEGKPIRAHKIILAARSEYFRALLFGGMRESSQPSVELSDTGTATFKVLLKYIYTGNINLASLELNTVIDVLSLVHLYGFSELQNAIVEYLKSIVCLRNFFTIFGAAHVYSLDSLIHYCLQYADRYPSEVLSSPAFINLTSSAVDEIIERDSFCAPEICIYIAVHKWAIANPDTDHDLVTKLVGSIRLPLLTPEELMAGCESAQSGSG